jgi:hypothetical protein
VKYTKIRFISVGKTAIKVSLPTPDGGYHYRSIGFKKIGKSEAVKLAVQERNRIGKQLWEKHWHRVVSDHTLLSRLPRNLEPVMRIATDRNSSHSEYTANWMVRVDGEVKKVARRYSCEKHGKLGAYTKAKQALLKAYAKDIHLLAFMGRASVVTLK